MSFKASTEQPLTSAEASEASFFEASLKEQDDQDISDLPQEPEQSEQSEQLKQSEQIELHWQKLIELGVPAGKAKSMARAIAQYYADKQAESQQQSIQARELIPVYWRRLIEVGIPIDAARRIAEAIAWLDTGQKALTLAQKALIGQYCVMVCRAELWRSGMLLK